jgi:hypothetical protein
MSSIWKDLLFLHGHLVRKEDLLWYDQTSPATAAEIPARPSIDRVAAALKDEANLPPHCMSRWPRLAAPH